jgi:hypothetical protein
MSVVKCPECQTKLRPPGDSRTFKCPRCSKVLRFPAKEQPDGPQEPDATDDDALPLAAQETSSELPVTADTEDDLPVLAGVDPDKNLPPLVDEEPEVKRKKVAPQVHVPNLGVKGFDLAEKPPEPPPRHRWTISLGRLRIRLLRLVLALVACLLVIGGAFAAQSVIVLLFRR